AGGRRASAARQTRVGLRKLGGAQRRGRGASAPRIPLHAPARRPPPPPKLGPLFWLLPSSATRSLRILIGTSLDDRVRIRSDRAVLRVASQLSAVVAGLRAPAIRAVPGPA